MCGIVCGISNAQPVITGVVNNASYAPTQPIALRSIAAVFGRGLTDGSSCLPPCGPTVDSDGILGTSMAGTQVLLNGAPVPMLYATPGQLGIQVPVELIGSRATVLVRVGTTSSTPLSVDIAQSAPAVFTQNQGGTGAAVLTHADGGPVTESRPARPGETVILYGTGLGQTFPPLKTGQLPATVQPLQNFEVDGLVQLVVGGSLPEIRYAGASPCCAGLDQINFDIPALTGSDRAISLLVAKGSLSNATSIVIADSTAPVRHVSSLTCDSQLSGAQCSVTLDGAAGTDGAIVALSVPSAALTVPLTVLVPAGANTAKFGVTANSAGTEVTEKVQAFLNGSVEASVTTGPGLGSSITAAGDPGTTPGDLFDISKGTVVNASSSLVEGYDVRNILGGNFGTGSEPGVVLFKDINDTPWPVSNNVADYFITFTTSSPITLAGFNLFLADDFKGTANRTVTRVRLFEAGNSTALSDVTVLRAGQTNYLSAWGSDSIVVSDSFKAVTASTFTMVFTANPLASPTADGPRVLELDARNSGRLAAAPQSRSSMKCLPTLLQDENPIRPALCGATKYTRSATGNVGVDFEAAEVLRLPRY